MIDAWRRRQDEDLHAQVHRDPICESPEVTFQFEQSSQIHRFSFGKTPFNSTEADAMMNDKWRFYETTNDALRFPYTDAIEKRSSQSDAEIAEDIKAKISDPGHVFSLPIVLKPNNGSLSQDVFIVDDENDLTQAIHTIRQNRDRGDQMLVQQYMGDENGPYPEIRAICLDGESQIVYTKNVEHATPGSRANPSYWTGSLPVEVEDPKIMDQIDSIASHLHEAHGVHYVAFDLKVDRNGGVWILEANSSPMGLERVEREMNNGPEKIRQLTDRMIDKIKNDSTTTSNDRNDQALEIG